jgi:hypothetical protein
MQRKSVYCHKSRKQIFERFLYEIKESSEYKRLWQTIGQDVNTHADTSLKGCTRLADASDKAYQLLAHGRWFSPGTPASSTTTTGRHDIAEILLKVALNTKKSNQIKSMINTCAIEPWTVALTSNIPCRLFFRVHPFCNLQSRARTPRRIGDRLVWVVR